jgi:sugar lactone lactonase YvrE
MVTENYRQHKIVRYQGDTVIQEIYRDDNGKSIFDGGEYALCLAENTNGDICTSNGNAEIVIAVDQSGKIRFRYDGTPAKREKPFTPTCIVTDSLGRIIVADYSNDCFHILDPDGEFLGCVENCSLEGHNGLSVDSEGRLWVGYYDSGEVKVIEYIK